jgi:N-acetylmuramoyl-L-alanine amidase
MRARRLAPVGAEPAPPGAGAADGPAPEALASRATDIDVLARTIWGEARGEPLPGMEAVAAVVVNRVAAKRRSWGASAAEVCLARRQFSCWNADDPNRAKLLALRPGDPLFETCLRVARRALAGVLADPTGGATHYHARGVHPRWARGRTPSAEIGRHVFYRDVDRPLTRSRSSPATS